MMQPHSLILKPASRLLIPLAVTALLLAFLPSPAVSDQGETPVARVNGMTLYQSDLDGVINPGDCVTLLGPLSEPRPPRIKVSSDHLRNEALQRLINIELLYQEGLKHRFPGIEEKVEKKYSAELQRMGGEKGLKDALSCVDMTGEDLKKIIFRRLVISRFLDKVVYSQVIVSEKELEEYYQRNSFQFRNQPSVRASQILIKVKTWSDPREVESAESKALKVHKEATKGSDFNKLVRKYSEEPSAGATGGDMGIIYKGNLHRPLESIIFSLPDGGVSEPLRYRDGILIFKVTAVKSSDIKPFNDVRDQCMTQLRQSKAQAIVQDLVNDLRSNASIEILAK